MKYLKELIKLSLTLWVDGGQAVLVVLVWGHISGAGRGVVCCVRGRDEVGVCHVRWRKVVGGRESWRVTGGVAFRVRCDHNPPDPCVVLQNLKTHTHI